MRYSRLLCVVAAGVCVLSGMEVMGEIDGKKLTIGNPSPGYGTTAPYFYAILDAAGFSDWIWYGPSPEHDVPAYHEVLSGEWGAAICYTGIDTAVMDPNYPQTSRQAMWLTQRFEFPDWDTNSKFTAPGISAAWSDPNENPAPLVDTAQSVIDNRIVEITIDYEVVDLEFLDPNFYPVRSTIGYLDEDTGNPMVAQSDRYCFLQTYTIRNIDPNENPVNNIEFYQLLHSHGADEYYGSVNSTYADVSMEDPLEYYTPYKQMHEVGDFRYDITQWNSTYGSQSTQGHTDFVTFSCVREPDWVDNDIYRDGHYYRPDFKPPEGTHINIENRQLNNSVSLFYDQVCGAMGWALGSLDANETVSLTVAFMFGTEQAGEPLIELTKTSDIDPNDTVAPEDEITYTICWENISQVTAENVVLVEYLPVGVTYPEGWDRLDPNLSVIPADPNYDQAAHTYTWDLGDVGPGESGCVSLRVVVNEKAEPAMLLTNDVRFKTTNLGVAGQDLDINVACWDSDVIYVDPRATGYNNGISWQHAYTDLQRAITRAAAGCGTEIWVAQGTYTPGRQAEDTFTIPNGVNLYGGFKGDETSRDDRKPDRYKTILTGKINDTMHNETVVTMGDDTILDGFTVTDGELRGIYAEDVTCSVENCNITENAVHGIEVIDSDVTIDWCRIVRNSWYGIAHEGEGYAITVRNCQILENTRYGVWTKNSTPTIVNSAICANGRYGLGYYGVFIYTPTDIPELYNNTIAYNEKHGIAFIDNDPNQSEWDLPDIQNCILWYNNDGGGQLAGYEFTQYSCVYDPNDSDGTDYTLDGFDNFSGNPGFAYEYSDDPNVVLNVHLAYDSPCIDMGSPLLSYADQNDIDAEARVIDSYVDIGADEVYSCDDDLTEDDIYNEVDWTADGIVNFHEYGIFARAWLSVDPNNPLCDPNDPGYVSDPNDSGYISEGDKLRYRLRCDIDDDMDVDMADFALFCDEWLWTACWKQSQMDSSIMMMAMGAGAESASVMTRQPLVMEAPAATPWSPEWFMGKGQSEQVSLVIGIYAVLDYIDVRLQEKPPNTESFYELQGYLLECLEEMKEAREEGLEYFGPKVYNIME